MRLESLKIQGFKSFGEKVELVFKPGIIAIVGPNGCGKSNITDAIRWVFGEQSARSLRGDQMGDVIFNGSSCCKPQGMAEVSLKLANLGSLSVPYQEIVISRRIFRSGETEYYLNKNPCRLKDIVDLFLDTALGKGAYSIVEQGKVDFIITAKPKERRLLIESAAGIMKYKTRKEDALKKMEATSQNLERLKDILGEVEKQKDNLYEQAKKTKIYKEYRSREDLLIQNIAFGQYLLLQKEQKILEEIHEQRKRKQSALMVDIARYNSELEKEKAALIHDEEQISICQKRVYSLENRLSSLSQQKQSCLKEADRLRKEEENIKQELEDLKTSQDLIEADLLATQKLLTEIDGLLFSKREKLKILERKSSAFQKTIHEKRLSYEIQRKDLLGLTNQETRLEHLCETLTEKQKDVSRRQDGLKYAFLRLKEGFEKKTGEIQNFQDRIAGQKQLLEECGGQKKDLLKQIEDRCKDLRDCEARLRELDKYFQSQKSRLFSLEEIYQNKEGYQESVKHLLAKKKNQKELNGLHGVIAELITVPVEYEKAVDAILENRIQWMVVNTLEAGLTILHYLQKQKIGRGTFIVMDNINFPHRLNGEQEVQTLNIQGLIGPALQVIQYEAQYAKVMEYFFGNTILVEDITSVKEVLKKFSGWYDLVTKHGEIVTSYGIISGGESGKTSPGFLTQKRMIEELHNSLSLIQEKIEKEEGTRKKVTAQIQKLEAEKECLYHKHHQLEMALNGMQKDLSHLESEKELCHQRKEEMNYKKDRLKADQKELSAELMGHQERLNKTREEKSSMEREIEAVSFELDNLTRQDRDFQNRLMESKIDLTSLEGQKKTLRVNTGHGQKSQELNAKKLDGFNQRGERITLDQRETKRRLSELQAQIPQVEHNYKVSITELTKEENRRRKRVEMISGIEKKLKKAQQANHRLALKIKEIELRLAEILTTMNHILQDKGLSVDRISSLDADFFRGEAQIKELQEQLQEVKESIVSLGTVNLMAIEEYNRSLERYGFLYNQKEDLVNSLDSLNSLISKINQDSCVKFKKTFEMINTNFQIMFTRLFNGGHAQLFLEQPENILETGIEIMVQPPGKKTQYLSLLSGGEKALTAISLIFAIYLLKPSPFCILDEIDASLDEANIDRFINLLKEFKQRTQFLLITHSKKTMQEANVIYGVTMEKPGLTKIVSLELNKIENGKKLYKTLNPSKIH